MSSQTTSAAAVSAVLRRGDLNPLGSGSPRGREGIRVKATGDRVRVVVDVDSPRLTERLANDVAAILTESGYIADLVTDSAFLVFRMSA